MARFEKPQDNLIRELGITESLYDFEVINNALMISRVYKLSCPKEYILNLSTVEKACRFWIKLHPFLQCYIKRDSKETIKFNTNNKKYFCYLNKDFSEYKNLEYLEINDTDDWINLSRQDLYIPFQEQFPLWRLKFVKINGTDDAENTDYSNYFFVFTNHHGICDGKNSVQIFIQFLKILNAILLNTRCEEMNENNIIESKYSFEELGENLIKTLDLNNFDSVCFDKKVVSDKFGNKKLNTNVLTSFDCIKIDGQKIKKLIQLSKIKTKDAKMTSILSTLVCLSIKNITSKLKPTDIDLNNYLKYEVLVSVREKLNLTNLQMGIYSTVIENQILDDLNEESFWKVAQQQSTSLHDRLKSNDDIGSIDSDAYIDALNDETKNIGSCNLFSISNIGRIDYDNKNPDFVIKMKEHYMFETLRHRGIGGYLLFGISSISNSDDLCWSFNYVEYYYSKEFINDLKHSIVTLIENLIA